MTVLKKRPLIDSRHGKHHFGLHLPAAQGLSTSRMTYSVLLLPEQVGVPITATHENSGRVKLQVFVALLRACQPDGRRTLVRQALDVLTPALVKRLPQTPDHKYPIWIRYTKRVSSS